MIGRLLVTLGMVFCLQSVVASQVIEKILAGDYQHKMISSGRNFPTVNLQRNHLGDICILLHHRISGDDIRAYYGWTTEVYQGKLDTLLAEGLLKRDARSGYVPTCAVMTLEDYNNVFKIDAQLLAESVQLIVRKLPQVQARYRNIEGFKAIPFQRASLFILSDVLLDNWQINSVEKRWLQAERPLRNGMRYYYSIQEKDKQQATEAFGIYGNMYRGYGPITVAIYGNRRMGINFINLSKDQFQEWFGMPATEDVTTFKQEVLKALLKFSQDNAFSLDEQTRNGFERLGFISGGSLSIPALNNEDQQKLSALAQLVTDDLVALLQLYTDRIKSDYQQSVYASEISFEEYAIWWYHVYYTRVTDVLVEQGHITKPSSGIFTYLLRE